MLNLPQFLPAFLPRRDGIWPPQERLQGDSSQRPDRKISLPAFLPHGQGTAYPWSTLLPLVGAAAWWSRPGPRTPKMTRLLVAGTNLTNQGIWITQTNLGLGWFEWWFSLKLFWQFSHRKCLWRKGCLAYICITNHLFENHDEIGNFRPMHASCKTLWSLNRTWYRQHLCRHYTPYSVL